ncbi:diaminopimelate decarboxylase [Rhodopila sp.]|jgi:diaminopimelate decarboxylase|uniref:diaminopimelate decarboxylase n=1 Tax=Rhodopila sp. TaxID=2480087 RepID=UPI002C1198DB|nr:diaminopimelate decarboxylase [Rhodopila sp.]HVZ06400.1 diaminopimelate decarboxylase [Rhodopila sp.]
MANASAALDHADDPSIQDLLALRPWLKYDVVDGLLMDGVPLAAIARQAGTPTWVTSAAVLRGRCRALADALAATGLDAGIHYAVKANDGRAVLDLMRREGLGADVVSGGELRKALAAGMPAADVVYSGVGKSAAELRLALASEVGQINVESAEELAMIAAIASELGVTARIALRVNPDVDAETNDKISTGRARDKFGIAYQDAVALYRHAATLPHVQPVGLATHIGSQITGLAPFRAAFDRLSTLIVALRTEGLRVAVMDCGGGLGIPYRNEPVPTPAGLAAVIKGAFHNLDVRVAVEPGRWLVGPTSVLLASVILVKQTPATRFIVLDAAMNDLARPAMYDAWHGIVPVSAADAARPVFPATVVGPVCESSDTFARGRALPPLGQDAVVAILDAGAYGRVMSSTYNARPLAAEAWVDGGHWCLTRERQTIEALWDGERLPT